MTKTDYGGRRSTTQPNRRQTDSNRHSGPQATSSTAPARVQKGLPGWRRQGVEATRDGLVEIQAAEPERRGISIATSDRQKSISASVSRWISGPPIGDVHFYGSGSRLTFDGAVLKEPLVYYLEGALAREFDASLIETGLPVAKSVVASVSTLPYWPTYRGCSPVQRRHYRQWLASGRSSQIEVGYVFIYFYGLERRIIVDGTDHEPIAREVLRLLRIYGNSSSFRRYASSLLWLIALVAPGDGLPDDCLAQMFNAMGRWNEDNLAALLAIYSRRQSPIPARVAFAVAEHAPKGVVVQRHRDRLAELFGQRYQSRCGNGIVPAVRSMMREVLLGNRTYSYLNEHAARLLSQARETARNAEIHENPLIQTSANQTLWFTWTGSCRQTTLRLLASRNRLEVSDRGIALEFSSPAEEIREAFAGCLRSMPDAHSLAGLAPQKERRKYDQFLSTDLQSWSFAREMLDIEGAQELIKTLF